MDIASNLFSNRAAVWLQKKNHTTVLAATLPGQAIAPATAMLAVHQIRFENHKKTARRRAAFFLTLSNSLSYGTSTILSPSNWSKNPFLLPTTSRSTLPVTR